MLISGAPKAVAFSRGDLVISNFGGGSIKRDIRTLQLAVRH